jgi:hypothetical protein
MEKKQTAVQWLMQQIDNNINEFSTAWQEEFNQALQMGREQIEEAVLYGNRQEFYDGTESIGQQYYNETFKP